MRKEALSRFKTFLMMVYEAQRYRNLGIRCATLVVLKTGRHNVLETSSFCVLR
jgi:hypothetical protein